MVTRAPTVRAKNELAKGPPVRSERALAAWRANWAKWDGVVSDDGRRRLSVAAKRNRPWLQSAGLSADGLRRLRSAAKRIRPWARSTGPRTQAGKRRSRLNAVRSGRHARRIEPWASMNALCDALKADADPHAVNVAAMLDAVWQRIADELGIPVLPRPRTLGGMADVLIAAVEVAESPSRQIQVLTMVNAILEVVASANRALLGRAVCCRSQS